MEVTAESAPAAPDIVAFTYGPLVLAGAFGREGLAPGSDIVVNERKYGSLQRRAVHAADAGRRSGRRSPAAVRAGGIPLEFTILSAEQKPVRLIPYHRIAHERYATYWKIKPAAA